MVKQIRIYYEGDAQLKEGFHALFQGIKERAARSGCTIRFIAVEATPERDYRAGRRANPDAENLLLRDSEGEDDGRLFETKCPGLDASHRDSVFWMVQLMEAWFLADPTAGSAYYGVDESKLKGNPEIEKIPKRDVLDRLDAASRNSQKGKYRDHKARHGRDLLCRIRIEKARDASNHCRRLCDRLESLL